MLMLVDTGASISILPLEIYDELKDSEKSAIEPTTMVIRTGNSGKVDVRGTAKIRFELEGMFFKFEFYICGDCRNPIIGFDFQQEHDLYLRPAENALYIGKKRLSCFDHASFWGKAKVTMFQNYTIEPNHEAIIPGRVINSLHDHNDKICVVDQAILAIERTGALVSRTIGKVKDDMIPIRMMNVTAQPITIRKGVTIAIAEPISNIKMLDKNQSNSETRQNSNSRQEQCTCQCDCLSSLKSETKKLCCHKLTRHKNQTEKYDYFLNSESLQTDEIHQQFENDNSVPVHVKQLYLESLAMLENVSQRNRLANMLTEYSDCFAINSDDFGRTDVVKHKIDTGDHPPVRQRCRRFCRAHIDVIREQVKKLADNGTIRPSNSEWAANPVIVDKKTGDKRMCMDYRALNAVTMNPDSYLLPRIDDTLDALSGARYFCTLDMIQGYHHVELTEDSKPKTAFHAPHCNPSQWEYNYMPFGLVRAPRTFQRLMDKVIEGLEFESALAYLDDVIVFGNTIDQTLDRLLVVLERFRKAKLKLKAKKCLLFATEVKYLGHVISERGVSTDPDKIKNIVKMHRPQTVKNTRSFLGMVNYYSKFLPMLAEVAAPLHNITKKNAKFNWTSDCEKSFIKLKELLTSAPIMAYPTRDEMFVLDTDASNFAYGAGLSQLQKQSDGTIREKVITYASKKFSEREAKYCARRRELLAIVEMVKHFRVYLLGPTFLVRTDHASLKYLKTMNTDSLPGIFFRYIMNLEQFSMKLEIRKGVLHSNADTMSRTCSGVNCICDKILEYERRHNVKPGMIIEHNTNELNELVAIPLQKFTSYKCVLEKCTIQAYRIRPQYSAAELAKLQEEDPDLKPVRDWIKTEKEEPNWDNISRFSTATKAYFADYNRLVMKDDVLYRIWESADETIIFKQLIAPRVMKNELCRLVHDERIVSHMGRRKTLHALSHFCYWFKMHRDVAYWIRTCDSCQRRKIPHPIPKAPMKIYLPGEPGQRVAMDVCGPLKETTSGNKYVLVISDHFSKYTEAYPMPDQTAETIAKILVKEWFVKKGPPEELHTDQGANFESKLIAEICKLYDIEKTRTTPYHPQGDGQVERFNRSLMDIIYGMEQKHKEWDETLP